MRMTKCRAVPLCAILLLTAAAATVPALAQHDTLQPTRVRISQAVLQAFIVHKVLPEYPEAALKSHVEGAVTVTVFIDAHGDVEKTSDAKGEPLLVPAATEALKQWKFNPYYLNKQPVEVESQVTITFELKGNKGTVRSAI